MLVVKFRASGGPYAGEATSGEKFYRDLDSAFSVDFCALANSFSAA